MTCRTRPARLGAGLVLAALLAVPATGRAGQAALIAVDNMEERLDFETETGDS